MNTDIKSIDNIFPLIDDPMNIFYSKIKQWMKINSNLHLHCKATSRVDREVECSFNGISRVYKCKFKTYEVLKEEDIGQYLYIQYSAVISDKATQEITSSGEVIPVDIGDIYILEDSPVPVLLGEGYTDTILYEERPYTTKPCYYFYIRVNKVYKNEYSQLDIENAEKDYHELHFEDAYRQSVGRLWVIREPLSDTTKHYCDLDSLCSWELYNIDSENHYTLMDKSNTPPDDFNCTHIWPIQYGPGIDHKSEFYSIYRIGTHPYVETIASSDFWVEIREKEWAHDGWLLRSIAEGNNLVYSIGKLRETSEPYLNTRGQVPGFLKYLFEGLKFDPRRGSHCGEAVILLLSYIGNLNLRYLLCRIKYASSPSSTDSEIYTPLKEVLSQINPDPSTLEGNFRVVNILNGETYRFKDFFLGGVITKIVANNFSSITYAKNEVYSLNELRDKVLALYPSSQAIKQSFDQNELSPYYPNTNWYIRQFVYAMEFLRYNSYEIASSSGDLYLVCEVSFPFKYFKQSSSYYDYLRYTIFAGFGR